MCRSALGTEGEDEDTRGREGRKINLASLRRTHLDETEEGLGGPPSCSLGGGPEPQLAPSGARGRRGWRAGEREG